MTIYRYLNDLSNEMMAPGGSAEMSKMRWRLVRIVRFIAFKFK